MNIVQESDRLPVGNLFRGVSAIFRAISLLFRERKLRRLAIRPLVTNVIVVGVGVPLSLAVAAPFIRNWLPEGKWWSVPLSMLLVVLYIGLITIASFFVMTMIAQAIAGPQCTRLSREVERMMVESRGSIYNEQSLPFVKDVFQNLILTGARLLLFVCCYLPILLTQFLPPPFGQIIFISLSIVYGAFVLSLDYGDYTFERHYKTLRDKIRFIFRHKLLHLGYGTTALLLLMIPFLNLIILPICVTGYTMLYIEEQSSGYEVVR